MSFITRKQIRKIWIVTTAIFLYNINSFSQSDTCQKEIHFDIPVLDFPFQSYSAKTQALHNNHFLSTTPVNVKFRDYFLSYTNPSMNQSLNWSASWYTFIGYEIDKGVDKLIKPNTKWKKIGNNLAGEVLYAGSNALLFANLPLGIGWTHEEYHRAGMTTNYVYSYNGINSLNSFGSTTVGVSNIYDQNLAYFKQNDPAGFNRMLVAGGEGELQLIRKLQLNNLYQHSSLPNTIWNLIQKIGIVVYPKLALNGDLDEEIHTTELKEISITQRDFTGPDYSGWAWHLFKPNVPYTSLGIHPSGVGIDRYVSSTELTNEEQKYLLKASNLMFLNFLSPMNFGFYKIKIRQNKYANFAVSTYLNGFGYDINPEFYYMANNHNLYFGLHNYQNFNHSFWGAEAGAFKEKWKVYNRNLLFDARLMLWTQPKDQVFKTGKASFGGLIESKLYYPIKEWLYSYLNIEAKTKGWVAGNPFLKENISVRAGISMKFKK